MSFVYMRNTCNSLLLCHDKFIHSCNLGEVWKYSKSYIGWCQANQHFKMLIDIWIQSKRNPTLKPPINRTEHVVYYQMLTNLFLKTYAKEMVSMPVNAYLQVFLKIAFHMSPQSSSKTAASSAMICLSTLVVVTCLQHT